MTIEQEKQMQLNALTPQQQQLVELAARVPEDQVPAAKRMLQSLIVDPFWLSLQAAPYDDEPVTPEEEVAVEAARESIRLGEPLIPHEDILREFGLNED
jgi:hypothetical protein